MSSKPFLWALIAGLAVATAPLPTRAQVAFDIGVTIGQPPPPIPVYDQPPVPGPNYIWMPGYWAWGPGGWYWVPGTWVLAPDPGLLWTPGYWGWNGFGYAWNAGYWAVSVGFYGGVDYGCGYFGTGYDGGRWFGHTFRYNGYVTNVDPQVANDVYVDRSAYVNRSSFRVSYDGGHGGLNVHASAAQLAVAHSRHYGMTAVQRDHVQIASQDRDFLATVNHGHPGTTAIAHPFSSFRQPTNASAVTAHDRSVAQGHVVRGPQHHAAPAQHAYAPPQHHAAPAQHAYAPPQHHAAPAQHAYAPPQHHAAPAQHAYAPQAHAARRPMRLPAAGARKAAPPARKVAATRKAVATITDSTDEPPGDRHDCGGPSTGSG